MFKRARDWLWNTFTSIWARVLCYGGAILFAVIEIISYVDPTPLIPYLPPNWVPIAMVAAGILAEVRRRYFPRQEE